MNSCQMTGDSVPNLHRSKIVFFVLNPDLALFILSGAEFPKTVNAARHLESVSEGIRA